MTKKKYSPRHISKRNKIFLSVFSVLLFILFFHTWLHLANPYARINFVDQPYVTNTKNGEITYSQNYKPEMLGGDLASLLGYYRSGFLILQNTIVGGQPIQSDSADEIIKTIHKKRFDPSKPYLISGDQFSVLYTRNLGVFYNQLLNPNTAHSKTDWENRQRIYLQSVLYGIDGLSASATTRTTIVPIGPRTSAATQVHPGGIGSDSVYGILYALDTLSTPLESNNGQYSRQTKKAAKQVIESKKEQLRYIVINYLNEVQNPQTKLVRTGIHLSSARDGVIRKSSFYDNVVLWKTLQLADKLGIYTTSQTSLNHLRKQIIATYWNEEKGYFNNDQEHAVFSSDWLLAYPTEFLNIKNKDDRAKTERIIQYIRKEKLASPLPIKYQVDNDVEAPWAVKTFVPNYGGNAIWSYWGAEYMTLLANMYTHTQDKSYLDEGIAASKEYRKKIVQYGGFPETFNEKGEFLQNGVYKSIRITGWVVQFEYAEYLLKKYSQ